MDPSVLRSLLGTLHLKEKKKKRRSFIAQTNLELPNHPSAGSESVSHYTCLPALDLLSKAHSECLTSEKISLREYSPSICSAVIIREVFLQMSSFSHSSRSSQCLG